MYFILFQECELDKKTGEMKITRKTVFEKLLPKYANQKTGIVCFISNHEWNFFFLFNSSQMNKAASVQFLR